MFTETLTKDHREIEQNLKDILDSDTIDNEKLDKTLKDIQQHMVVEEKYLYPEAKDDLTHKERSNLVEHSYEEHSEGKDLLLRLTNTDYQSDDTKRKDIQALYDDLTHHHEDEEEDVFPKLEKKLDDKDIKSVSTSIEAGLNNMNGFVSQ